MHRIRPVLPLCLLFPLAGCSSRPASIQVSGPSPYGQEGIRVSGTAIVRAEPDLAIVTLGCESRAGRARPAKEQCDATMRRVLDAIRGQGVAGKDIQTVSYSLGETYEGRARYWRVQNSVQVRIRDYRKAADVVDAAADAGANSIGSIRYEVEELHELRGKAREQAARVAREKAQQLAGLMGVRLGKAVSVADNVGMNYYPWYGYSNYANAQRAVQMEPRGDAEPPDDQLASGMVAVQAREEVTFAIER